MNPESSPNSPVTENQPSPVAGPLPAVEIFLRLLHAGMVAAAFLLLGLAYILGFLYQALILFLLIMAPAAFVIRAVQAVRKKLFFRFLPTAFRREARLHLIQCINRALLWCLLATTLSWAVVPIDFEPGEYRFVKWFLWALAAILLALEAVPARRIRLAPNLLYGAGWIFLAVQLARMAVAPATEDVVELDPPFRGEWFVVHGGPSVLFNHHYVHREQRDALDLVGISVGRRFHGDPERLESYVAFGQDILAPSDGMIVKAQDGHPDVEVGGESSAPPEGNHIVMKIVGGRFVLLAHLMKGSLSVAAGDHVGRGQKIARCGNSGNTSEPHLHLQAQSHSDVWHPQSRTYPIHFRGAMLVRGGAGSQPPSFYAVRNDVIRAATDR